MKPAGMATSPIFSVNIGSDKVSKYLFFDSQLIGRCDGRPSLVVWVNFVWSRALGPAQGFGALAQVISLTA